ncbi:hypothetical protein ACFYXS_01330 [Streptomyces sp. NPDC002574]|uniref:hypothetical protein n=1 Tax=Streptomyces sp. NPDC002574 TaxID=3364652 RepID=UPI0036CDE244
MLTAASALGVAVVTAAGDAITVVVGRRQPRDQRRRDDFTVFTDRMEKEITRQGARITDLEAESEQQQARITTQDFTIRYLAGWIRDMVGYIRVSGLEPPTPPQPIPDEVRPYLHDVGV